MATHLARFRWFTLLFIFALVGTIGPAPAVLAQSTPQYDLIDMDRDEDGDGVPDELAEEVNRLADMIAANRYDEAIPGVAEEIINRLPYSDSTRARQRRMARLTQELYETDDDTEAQAIVEDMWEMERGMMTDPGYAQTSAALERMLAQTPAASWNHRVYLPIIAFKTRLGRRSDDAAVQEHTAADLVLQQGDVLLRDDQGSSMGLSVTDFIYKVDWGHAGVVDDDESVYSSNIEGVRFEDYDLDWLENVDRIWQGRAWDDEAQAAVVASLERAKVQYGVDGRTPYNFRLFDKQRDDRLYCSQLVWKIYLGVGIDLDSNDPTYAAIMALRAAIYPFLSAQDGAIIARLAVAPDEIALDDDLRFIAILTAQRD